MHQYLDDSDLTKGFSQRYVKFEEAPILDKTVPVFLKKTNGSV
jgi:hypothetical protein